MSRRNLAPTVAILFAVALLFQRSRFPTQLIPEYGGLGGVFAPEPSIDPEMWKALGSRLQVASLLRPSVDLQGRDTLVIGDSQALAWPWPADKIAAPGMPIPGVQGLFRRHVKQQNLHYDQIIVWSGSVDTSGGISPLDCVQRLHAIVQEAYSCTSSVLVVSPMPFNCEQSELFKKTFPVGGAMIPDNRAVVDKVLDGLAIELPNTPVCDLRSIQITAEAGGVIDLLYADGFHFNRVGFSILAPRLRFLGWMGDEEFAESEVHGP